MGVRRFSSVGFSSALTDAAQSAIIIPRPAAALTSYQIYDRPVD